MTSARFRAAHQLTGRLMHSVPVLVLKVFNSVFKRPQRYTVLSGVYLQY